MPSYQVPATEAWSSVYGMFPESAETERKEEGTLEATTVFYTALQLLGTGEKSWDRWEPENEVWGEVAVGCLQINYLTRIEFRKPDLCGCF